MHPEFGSTTAIGIYKFEFCGQDLLGMEGSLVMTGGDNFSAGHFGKITSEMITADNGEAVIQHTVCIQPPIIT